MHILQHVLLCVRELGTDDWCNEHLAYVTLPDAIRGMGVPRRCSHFERNEQGDVSWYRYPNREQLRTICPSDVMGTLAETSHAADIRQTVKGGDTDIAMYRCANPTLETTVSDGIVVHLMEDIAYDRHIQSAIDCSGADEYRFVWNGKVLTGGEFRDAVAASERDGITILCRDIRERHGIVVSNEWIDTYVGAILRRDLSPALANNQLRYLRLDDAMERRFADGDYSIETGHIADASDWERMYDMVGSDISDIAHGDRIIAFKYELVD